VTLTAQPQQGDAVAAPTADAVSTRRSDSRNWLTHWLALHKPRLPNNEPEQGMSATWASGTDLTSS